MFRSLMIAATALVALVTPVKAVTITPTVGGIKLSGEIVKGDAARLAKAITGAKVVVLNSPGGLVEESLRMTALIRKSGAATLVKEMCASACFNLFLGGVGRVATADAMIGVHNISTVGKKSVRKTDPLATVQLALIYKQAGVPQSVLAKMLLAGPSEMGWLSDAEICQLGVIADADGNNLCR